MGSQFLAEEQLRKLPYLRNVPKDGRTVPLLTFFRRTAQDWHLYLPVKPGELGRLAGGEPISGSYLASAPADPGIDFELKLGTLIVQHMSFSDLLEQFGKLENDVHRCSAVLETYDVLWAVRASKERSASLLIQSQLEYLLFLLRAMYDVLQAVVQIVARKLVLVGGDGRPALKNLPHSFSDIVIKDRQFRPLGEIQSRWKVPCPLAEWYVSEGPFFQLLRDLRDGIAHQGANPPTVFETEWGFAIAPDAPPWSRVEALLRGERYNGRLAFPSRAVCRVCLTGHSFHRTFRGSRSGLRATAGSDSRRREAVRQVAIRHKDRGA